MKPMKINVTKVQTPKVTNIEDESGSTTQGIIYLSDKEEPLQSTETQGLRLRTLKQKNSGKKKVVSKTKRRR